MSRDKIVNRMTDPSFRVPNKFWDEGHGSLLGVNAGFVWLCLLRHANSAHQSFPSYSCMEKETGLSRPTIAKSITKLTDLGYIRELNVGNSKGNATTDEIMDLPIKNSFEK